MKYEVIVDETRLKQVSDFKQLDLGCVLDESDTDGSDSMVNVRGLQFQCARHCYGIMELSVLVFLYGSQTMKWRDKGYTGGHPHRVMGMTRMDSVLEKRVVWSDEEGG